MIALGCASSMRVASSLAAKPPKTTEWIAPIRAGQHRLDRLGDHRHVDHHPVALGHAARGQRAGKAGHPVAQLGIGDPVDRPGHRAVVDQRRLRAAPGLHMPVHRVPAGVDQRVGEPLVMTVGIGGQGPRRGADPVDGAGLLHPEAVRIRQAAAVDVAIVHEPLPGCSARPMPQAVTRRTRRAQVCCCRTRRLPAPRRGATVRR